MSRTVASPVTPCLEGAIEVCTAPSNVDFAFPASRPPPCPFPPCFFDRPKPIPNSKPNFHFLPSSFFVALVASSPSVAFFLPSAASRSFAVLHPRGRYQNTIPPSMSVQMTPRAKPSRTKPQTKLGMIGMSGSRMEGGMEVLSSRGVSAR